MQPQNILDTVVFGRYLRSLRIKRGYDRVTELVDTLNRLYGIGLTDRIAYAIERGEQMPRLDFYLAMVATLNADRDYFSPAIRADIVEKLEIRPGRV